MLRLLIVQKLDAKKKHFTIEKLYFPEEKIGKKNKQRNISKVDKKST